MPLETIHLLLRITARCSGSAFMLSFAAPGMLVLSSSGFAHRLAAVERPLFLLFVVLHTVHLGFVVLLARTMGPSFFEHPAGLMLAGTVYVLIYALVGSVLLSSGTPRGARFRTFGFYAIWTAFAIAFTVSMLRYPAVSPIVLGSYAALAIRIAAAVRSRSPQRSSAVA